MSTPPPPPPPPAAAPPPPPSAPPPPPPADDRPTLTQIDEYQHSEEMEAQADMFDKIGKQVRDFFKRVGSSRCVLAAGGSGSCWLSVGRGRRAGHGYAAVYHNRVQAGRWAGASEPRCRRLSSRARAGLVGVTRALSRPMAQTSHIRARSQKMDVEASDVKGSVPKILVKYESEDGARSLPLAAPLCHTAGYETPTHAVCSPLCLRRQAPRSSLTSAARRGSR